uniref:G-protein coupled receptors family 1 profile domain-containing protein n=1 Tax=Strigamia maritima TaxID=126957 RepID=T1J5R3_STRMM
MDQVLYSSQNIFGHENHTRVVYDFDTQNVSTVHNYNPTNVNNEQHRSWPNCWAVLEFLNKYYIPVIVAVGTIGNSISCIVFLCTHLRIRSSSYYLAALAVADVGFLLTLFLVWLASVGVEVFNLEGWCQIAVYLSSTSSFLSVWFIIAFTVERFIAIQYPLQRPQMCTVKRAKLTISILSLFAFLIHSYLLCVAGLVRNDAPSNGENSNASYACGLLPDHYRAMRIINSVDTVITLILPLLLIVTMNSLIARQLYQFSSKHRHQVLTLQLPSGCSRPSRGVSSQSQSGSSESKTHNNNYNSRNSNDDDVVVLKGSDLNADTSKPPSHRSILSQRTQYTITKMLLLISTVFIILNLPSYMFRIYLFVGEQSSSSEMSTVTNEYAFILQQFSMLLYYSNFSINFILYSMYGMTFRRALMQLIRSQLDMAGIWRSKSDSLQFK